MDSCSRPRPIWIEDGRRSKVWDVDGNQYVDHHGGYGAMLVGHAHPAIVERCASGSGGAPILPSRLLMSSRWFKSLSDRDGQPLWRFGKADIDSYLETLGGFASAISR
ncbi:MAG TPA: aminotransferase class III-fold pyridoxal phosphate-dependent enzyme [Acidimicrobiia bacterium]